MKMWMQFNVKPWTSLGVDAVERHAQDANQLEKYLSNKLRE